MAGKVTSNNEYANSLLKLIFNATAFANMADNASSSPFTNLYVSLHTSSPTASGNQSSNEVTYSAYNRVAVARSGSGWTVTNNSVSPAATISFPAATDGSETATHFGVGTSSSGSGHLLYFGSLSPTIAIANGVTPQITTSSTISET